MGRGPRFMLRGMLPIGIQDENRMGRNLLADKTKQAVIHAAQFADGLLSAPGGIRLITFLMAEPEAQQLANPVDLRPEAAAIRQHMFDGGGVGCHWGMTPKTAGVLGF